MAADRESQNLWEAIGGLRANVQRLLEGQQKTDERLDRLEYRLDRKFDRLLYAVIALGGGVTTLLIMEIVRG